MNKQLIEANFAFKEWFKSTNQTLAMEDWSLRCYMAGRDSILQANKQDTELIKKCADICESLHHDWRFDDADDSDSGPRACKKAILELLDKE